MSFFANVEQVPGDPILGLTEAYNADSRPTKVNLGVGIYYDESGRIPLLRAVQQIERQLAQDAKPRGYLPIDGLPAYDLATQKLLFGAESPLLAAGRVATSQTIGGSGALRVGADLLKKLLSTSTIAISNPSWENHRAVFSAAGFDVVDYTYFDAATHGLNFDGMLADLNTLAPGTVVLLHACCHNPTGADLTQEQWRTVAALLKERDLFPFVDIAYQGFDKGIDEDAYAVRLLAEAGVDSYVVASSYSKSFSLYGERVGALSVVSANAAESKAVQSQVKRIVRTLYSSPSTHGAALVAGVLNSPELRAMWEQELTEMRERIHALRAGMVQKLAALGAPEFGFIQQQAGMFSYSGLSKAQVDRLREEFGIYAVGTGRICVAALSQANLDYVTQAVATVHKG
ncbi:aromatic amino acid transaminase [Xanthomonas translucens]|uniref:amino acid aminotransferase n=1 Tax=Xanthomonas campestris pv. translucens TaxID=343 RepID=UPI00071E9280|nr:amino acid aminotransferase [Xanthomonas translucens]KTF37354.1 aromatic amino acid aminotransferase [Xanthomonas translucens pv. translucens]KWV14100.1 aromatic amino acid aminotransferase [Xanthomonas translucens]MCS3360298.1 aspartate/tyrosine/aromatic aminotransferase [Xanthomonas translucens pv. translucens]MCS3374178.1 aspartate/tyrosine/aromatic aminotransferase [Xanthomonas translucens pv. translucens]MCT8274953.1 aspartate/tyrosine/aromatic aminotransferase [Xanthomonas translucens